jgi:hypothetical protein
VYQTVFELNASRTADLYDATADPNSLLLLLGERLLIFPDPLDLPLALRVIYIECRFIFSRLIFTSKYNIQIFMLRVTVETRLQAKANFSCKPATHHGTSAPDMLRGGGPEFGSSRFISV